MFSHYVICLWLMQSIEELNDVEHSAAGSIVCQVFDGRSTALATMICSLRLLMHSKDFKLPTLLPFAPASVSDDCSSEPWWRGGPNWPHHTKARDYRDVKLTSEPAWRAEWSAMWEGFMTILLPPLHTSLFMHICPFTAFKKENKNKLFSSKLSARLLLLFLHRLSELYQMRMLFEFIMVIWRLLIWKK